MSAKFIWRYNPTLFEGHFEDIAKERALEVAKYVFDGIVMRTPVRTGSLRASWRASIGQPDYSMTTNRDPFSPLPAPVFPLTSVPPRSKIYITNSQKYVLPIEFGWSAQAPSGMVRVTLASIRMGLSVRS